MKKGEKRRGYSDIFLSFFHFHAWFPCKRRFLGSKKVKILIKLRAFEKTRMNIITFWQKSADIPKYLPFFQKTSKNHPKTSTKKCKVNKFPNCFRFNRGISATFIAFLVDFCHLILNMYTFTIDFGSIYQKNRSKLI